MKTRTISLIAAGLLAASSLPAAAQDGPLAPGQPADVHEARIMGISPAAFVITTAIVATIVIVAVTQSSSSSTTH